MSDSRHDRRVVITGMGVIAANGQTLDTFWQTIREGQSAAGVCTRFDVSNIPCKFAAQVENFAPEALLDPKHSRRLDRSLQFSVAAAVLASRDARIDPGSVDPDQIGVVEATSLSNNESAYTAKAAFLSKGYKSVAVSAMINGAAGGGSGEIANELKVRGHAITLSTTSASGNDAMGYAASMIRHEGVDVMIAGGAEAPIIESVWGGFCLNRVMTRNPGDPKKAMKPFDRNRDGFILGEGGAFVVMEELSHALGRGARIYAEILGHGRSCEAYHPLTPHPEGRGVTRALEKAFRQSGLSPESVDYINAHGTATEANDAAETRGIENFFGTYTRHLAVSATKPITGHLMAAAGALETIICALAISRQAIPPSLNCDTIDPDCGLDIVRDGVRPYPVNVAVNLNSGFGGKNSCLVLGSYPRLR